MNVLQRRRSRDPYAESFCEHDDLIGVVQETMQPSHVSLWLRPG